MHMLAHLLKRRDFPLSWTLASEERCKWSVSAAEVSAFTDTQGSGRGGCLRQVSSWWVEEFKGEHTG